MSSHGPVSTAATQAQPANNQEYGENREHEQERKQRAFWAGEHMADTVKLGENGKNISDHSDR